MNSSNIILESLYGGRSVKEMKSDGEWKEIPLKSLTEKQKIFFEACGASRKSDKDGYVQVNYSKIPKKTDEGQWKTMRGNHILVDDKGGILAGGPKSMRKKISADELKREVKDANSISKSENSKKDGRKSANDINSMSRDDRIQYGKDLCRSITGKDEVVDSNAGLLYWAKVLKGEERDIINKALGSTNSEKKDKFWKEYDVAKKKHSLADDEAVKYRRKLNSGEKMSEKDLKNLEKTIKAEEEAWKALNSVLDKYGVVPKKY